VKKSRRTQHRTHDPPLLLFLDDICTLVTELRGFALDLLKLWTTHHAKVAVSAGQASCVPHIRHDTHIQTYYTLVHREAKDRVRNIHTTQTHTHTHTQTSTPDTVDTAQQAPVCAPSQVLSWCCCGQWPRPCVRPAQLQAPDQAASRAPSP